MNTLLAFVGRLMIALLFIVSGFNKLMDVGGTDAMIRSVGLPAGLALPVGLFELVCGIALVLGVATRAVAVFLALFSLAAAFFFHNNFADPMQAANLLKNLAIAGGLLCLTAHDTVRWSYDSVRLRRRAEQEQHRAEERAHEAEIRAARAEGAMAATQGATVVDPQRVNPDGTLVRKRRWSL